MSTRAQRVIRDNYNHGFGDLGDLAAPPGLRHEIEDDLIQVLHDCICGPNLGLRSVNIRPFREWLRSPAAKKCGWNPNNVELCSTSDADCEVTIHFTVCTLKRLSHLHEWSTNWLIQNGLPIEMIPSGQEYLGF